MPTLSGIRSAFALRHAASPAYLADLGVTCNRLAEFVGHEIDAGLLGEELLSAWVKWLEECRSPRTAKKHRANLLILLRFAADLGLIERSPDPHKVRRPKVPPPAPIAWSPEEMARLIEAAALLPGKFPNGIPRGRYFALLLRVARESGLRRSDLFALRLGNLSGTRGLVRMQKTKEPHTFELHPETAAEFRSLAQEFGTVTPLKCPGGLSGYRRWFKRVKALAGIVHEPRQMLQQVRRSGATEWENIDPGYTSAYLGHKTPDMKRHYVDRSKLAGRVRLLPAM